MRASRWKQRDSFISVVMLVVAGLQLLSAGCGREANQGGPAPVADRVKELKVLQVKREDNQKRLKGLSVPQLAQELASDSGKGREPFNSAAYRELVSRGPAAGADLKAALTRNDRSSLLGLLALRQISPDQYRSLDPAFRASVLIDALRTAQYFNSWGIPHLYWEDAAKATIEEGQAAVPGLEALLGDKRPAPVFGSEGAAINAQYRYRVCDYAWALLNEIGHQKVEIPADPAARDQLIQRRIEKR